MKYAIMGAGGVGGYFGARLAAAGGEVAFIARGGHKAAMQANGLALHSPLGDLHIEAPEVVDNPAEAGRCDVILFCVKLWDVEAAAETIRPLLSRDTCVLPIQNGVSVTDTLSRLLGARHVMGGVTQISASIEAPGVIRHHGDFARLIFGELDGSASRRQECLLAACQGGGIEARVSPNIEVDIWEKFIFLAPMAGATAFYRAAIGEVRDHPERRARFEAMLRETANLGRAKGVALPEGLEERLLGFVDNLPPEMKSSMQLDLERGKRLELDWLNGEVVRLGQELGVATPENAAVYEALKPYAMGQGG